MGRHIGTIPSISGAVAAHRRRAPMGDNPYMEKEERV
jgi:hypothetical protein